MIKISTDIIKQVVYNLCFQANICLNYSVYSKIYSAFENEKNSETKNYLKNILQNAKIAFEQKMPLCQDTGQVIIFLEIGQNIFLEGGFIEDEINYSVQKCYEDNFFRKSTVKNAVFDRTNTKTNTPVIIYTKYTKDNDIKIKVLIKGAGSENKSKLEMMLPTSTKEEITQKCAEMILQADVNACPPMFIGIGIGATADKAMLLSKEALVSEDFTKEETELAQEIKKEVNGREPNGFENCYILEVKLKTTSTHIACMPVAVTINCHSDRFSKAVIKENEIIYDHKIPDFEDIIKRTPTPTLPNGGGQGGGMQCMQNNSELITEIIKEIKTDDIEDLKSLKKGEEFLLTGEVYVARDMAHKKIVEMLSENKPLPFNLKDKIIFYAGPCPSPEGKIIGSIGPTTSSRMDKYAIELYKHGIFATIGKGSRSREVMDYLQKTGKKYFTVQGGIAALLAQKITKNEIIAFEELGAEAIYKIQVEKFPLISM